MAERGEWKVVSKRDEELVAFKAFVSMIKNKSSDFKAGSGKKDTQFSWKEIGPVGTEPLFKTVNHKDYQYCQNHGKLKWVLVKGHKDPPGCTALKGKKASGGASAPAVQMSKPKVESTKSLETMKAMLSVFGVKIGIKPRNH